MSHIKLFFVNLIHRFIYSAKEYLALDKTMRSWVARYENVIGKNADLAEVNDKLQHQVDDYVLKIKAATERETDLRKQVSELSSQIARFDEYKRVDAEYLRETQKQLAEEFGMHPVFGFRSSVGLPGSISMEPVQSAEETYDQKLQYYTSHCGRIILDDWTTKQINTTPHMRDKMMLVLRFMDTYGSLSKIMWDLIMSGCMSFTLAYRPETTTYQAFYEIAAKNYNRESILTFDSETGCLVEEGEKKEEG